MRGRIIHYNANDGRGLVTAEGRQYAFDITQWGSSIAPAVNQTVEATLAEDRIVGLVLMNPSTLAREKLTALANAALSALTRRRKA